MYMEQQQRILKIAKEQIACIGRNGHLGRGKSFMAGFTAAINFTLNNLWINANDSLPETSELVLVAQFDVQRNGYQYYVGWYRRETHDWFLTDYGVTSDVSYWMPLLKPEASAL